MEIPNANPADPNPSRGSVSRKIQIFQCSESATSNHGHTSTSLDKGTAQDNRLVILPNQTIVEAKTIVSFREFPRLAYRSTAKRRPDEHLFTIKYEGDGCEYTWLLIVVVLELVLVVVVVQIPLTTEHQELTLNALVITGLLANRNYIVPL
ncbi:hypothetical protein M0804_008995 [Polistes exclamans]|nr:hypothetical protein M0804_008995 [Polistes exclamans]